MKNKYIINILQKSRYKNYFDKLFYYKKFFIILNNNKNYLIISKSFLYTIKIFIKRKMDIYINKKIWLINEKKNLFYQFIKIVNNLIYFI